MAARRILADSIRGHQETLDKLSSLADSVEAGADLLIGALKAGNKVLLCGNGGSSSDAQHFAGELVGRFLTERRPLPAIPLSGLEASLTAISNDYGYEQAFSRQVRAFGQPGDVLVAISTSGNSPNIVAAAEAANSAGVKVIGMTGESGGKMREISDVLLAAPSSFTPRIQEMHILLIHVLCEAIDDAFPTQESS